MRWLWPPPPQSLLPGLLLVTALCGGGAGAAPAPRPHAKLPPSAAPPLSFLPDQAPSAAPGGNGFRVRDIAENSSNGNGSSSQAAVPSPREVSPPKIQRALSVLVFASAALIIYFVVRTVRLRRKNRKTRRYGVLDTNVENTELTPLEHDNDDDDDDTTLFDANHPRR